MTASEFDIAEAVSFAVQAAQHDVRHSRSPASAAGLLSSLVNRGNELVRAGAAGDTAAAASAAAAARAYVAAGPRICGLLVGSVDVWHVIGQMVGCDVAGELCRTCSVPFAPYRACRSPYVSGKSLRHG